MSEEVFCSCDGFKQAVELGAIKHQSHELLNTKKGSLTVISYYCFGPEALEKNAIFEFCPACGQRVRLNHDFFALMPGEV